LDPCHDSLALSSDQANLDAAGCHLGVFLLADEVELSRPDVGAAGELATLVHGGTVPDRVVDDDLAATGA
jgi:hypothetical protein